MSTSTPVRNEGDVITEVFKVKSFDASVQEIGCAAEALPHVKALIPEMKTAIRYALGYTPSAIRFEVRQGAEPFTYDLVLRIGRRPPEGSAALPTEQRVTYPFTTQGARG